MSDTDDIKRAVANNAVGFAAWILPSGKRKASKWHAGDVNGNPGESLTVDLDGEHVGNYRDWATGEHGDCIALVMAARSLDFVGAIRHLREHYSLATPSAFAKPKGQPGMIATVKRAPPMERNGPKLPNDATSGTEEDWRELATLRHVSHFATATAARLGTLYFGTVCGFYCWILTDERRLCAEARRMDGQWFPAWGSLGARKAHTIKGSLKSWPVGLAVRGFKPTDFRAVLAIEGGGDYLAGLDVTLADKSDCLPIAFLGAGTGTSIHADALRLLRGLRVRFYPHNDPNGAGEAAVVNWANQFDAIGAHFDAFEFVGLRKADGSPVKDLNDCTQIHPDDAKELEILLP